MTTTDTEQTEHQWHGKFLSEEELYQDILAIVHADPEAVKIWLDPASWHIMGEWYWCGTHDTIFLAADRCPVHGPLPLVKSKQIVHNVTRHKPKYQGCLQNAGMSIRNWYGLWREGNPYTQAGRYGFEVTNHVITDPRFPDNMSERVIERVRAQLMIEREQQT